MANTYFLFKEKLAPKDSTVQCLLAFSKALSSIKSEALNEQIVCFKN